MSDETNEVKCPNPKCDDPVERHTAWWGGCKYCPCAWLPEEQALGALLFHLKQHRQSFTTNLRVQEHLSKDFRIPIETALDAAIRDLTDRGVRPLPSEGEAYDDCEPA